MSKTKLCYLSKKAIWRCICLVKSFLHDKNVESEECFSKMLSKLDCNKFIIPPEIYDMIEKYVIEHISPIVYAPSTTFDISKHGDELMEMARKTPDSPLQDETYRNCCNFMMVLGDIEEDFDRFAIENLQPLLLE